MRLIRPPLLLIPLLAACGSDRPSTGGDALPWQPVDPGLLLDPEFVLADDTRRLAWTYTQHGGEMSYRYDIGDGVLTIERFGPEPWGQATQLIDPAALHGATLEFSAEVSGSFELGEGRMVQASGIGARVLGYPPGVPLLGARHIMLVVDGEPEFGPGELAWTRQSLRFEVPEGATDIEVAIRLGMEGYLRVRGPSLMVVAGGGDAGR
jgi:hypothetical protein